LPDIHFLDNNGNRTHVTTDPEPLQPGGLINRPLIYSYNTQRNRLNSTTGTVNTFGYDNEGQQTTKNGATYGYDNAHRLTSIGTTAYSYDGVGNRLRATRNGVTTRYVYDAAGNLLAEANASGAIQKYYIHAKGLAAMVTAGGQLYVYHFDGSGHTVALTDANKAIANTYAYSPYGKVFGQQETIAQPFKYAGQVGVMDEGNDLYYMRARYYDASVGRFISEDPSGFGDGPNLYAYVGGNPITAIDPTGLGTFALGGAAGVNGFLHGTVSVQGSISWNPDALGDLSQWRLGGIFSVTPFTGGTSGIGGSVGGLATYTSANSPEALRGWSGYTGASGGVGLVGGVDVGNLNNQGAPRTINFFGGFGAEVSPEFAGLPAEVHAGAGWTAAGSFPLGGKNK